MSENVVQLQLVDGVGDGFVVPAEQVLEQARGKYTNVVVVGEREDGEIEVCGSHGAGDTIMLLAWAQAFLVQSRTVRA